MSERRLRETFPPCHEVIGIRLRKAYNTRHTFATINLMAGVNSAYIATQLGHADTTMLFKHYVKWIRGADSGPKRPNPEPLSGPGKPSNWPQTNVMPIKSKT